MILKAYYFGCFVFQSYLSLIELTPGKPTSSLKDIKARFSRTIGSLSVCIRTSQVTNGCIAHGEENQCKSKGVAENLYDEQDNPVYVSDLTTFAKVTTLLRSKEK